MNTVVNSITTRYQWGVSVTTGHGIEGAQLNVYSLANGKIFNAECAGKLFPNSHAAFAHAHALGFCRTYYSRPNAFIHLRVSRATRRFLRNKSWPRRWQLLDRMFAPEGGAYWNDVRTLDCFQTQRLAWMHYLDGENQRPVPLKRGWHRIKAA